MANRKIDYIKAENCTSEVLTPIVADIKVAISGAIVEVNALIGQPAAVILASVNGGVIVTVSELAALVAGLLCVS